MFLVTQRVTSLVKWLDGAMLSVGSPAAARTISKITTAVGHKTT